MNREKDIGTIAHALSKSEKCFMNDECIMDCEKHFKDWIESYTKEVRADTIEDVKHQMISFHTDAIFRYGVDIIEAKCDAFDDLENWLKEQK